MGLHRANDIELRFAGYVEGLVSVIGHADRAGPLRDYCVGLMMPCERKSVEPMAAVTAPERTAAQHQSLLHFVGKGGGRTRRSWPRCARWCCRRSSGTGRSRPGSSTTRAFPSRDGIRWAWRGNIAASLASRTIARWRCRCRLPTTMRACRWRIGCICRRTGLRIAGVGTRRACLRRSASRPSRRSRSISSAGRARPAFRAAWC